MRIYSYVWHRRYLALDTCVPLVDGVGHTIGRLNLRFDGTRGYEPQFQHLHEAAWQVHVFQALLKPQEGMLPPEEWDSRVKVSCYPGTHKGSTPILQGNLLARPTLPKYGRRLDFPYVLRLPLRV